MASVSFDLIGLQRAEEIYAQNFVKLGDEGGGGSRELEADYLAASEAARRAFRAFLDLWDPKPEFCAKCGKHVSVDRYLERHMGHNA
jgi:hypothetical protein